MVALGFETKTDMEPLGDGQCAVCRKAMNMVEESWMGLDVQVGDVIVKLVVCEEHAGIIRARAAKRVTQAL